MYVFSSRFRTLTVVLKPSRKIVVGTEIVREPGLSARFENGVFQTEDSETAELLRKKTKGDHNVVEITEADQAAFSHPKPALNERGTVSSVTLKAPETSKTVKIEEKTADAGLTCPVCEKTFKTRQALDLHLVGHRAAVKIEETPAAAEAKK